MRNTKKINNSSYDFGSKNSRIKLPLINYEGDSGSASRFFYCAKASPSERDEINKHPTVKPQKLMEWLINLVSKEKSVILDPFSGSGTTAVACHNTNRQFICIEIDPEYYNISVERLKQAQKQMKLMF